MNAMITPSCLQKYVMWNKVRELKSLGLNNSQISRHLGLYRGTVARYLSMSESEFISSGSYRRTYSHKLDSYELYIYNRLDVHPYLSSSQIHDNLKEHFPSFPAVNSKTVYNYVQHVRQKYDLPKHPESENRFYEKQPEASFGEFAQVDFGERYMTTSSGGHVKIYFFAMVLSRSRAKFIYFSLNPFTTALAVYAHELAFQFYGGVPEKILYDQDKVLLHNENLGDLLLTHGFRKFVGEIGFETIFCRKTLPQVEMKAYYVRKDNTINYKGNYYTLPTGTYHGHNTLVYVHLNDTQVHLFAKETGKTLAVHPLCLEKGKLVRNSSHSRDNTASLQSLEDKIKNSLGAGSLIDEYLGNLHRDKSRYYRDNLAFINRHLPAFSTEIMHKAFCFCLEKGIYNANILIDVAKNLQKDAGEKAPEQVILPQSHAIRTYNMVPEKTDINIFNTFFQ